MMEFATLADLAHHLTRDTVGGLVATRKGLEVATAILQKEAKAEFGHYQDTEGPFPEWAELADSTKEDRLQQGFTENDPLLRRGDLRDSVERESGDWEGTVGSTSEIMPFHEFGTAKMPPRPVMGPALYRKAEEIAELIGSFAVSGLVGYQPASTLLYGLRDMEGMTNIHRSLGYGVNQSGVGPLDHDPF